MEVFVLSDIVARMWTEEISSGRGKRGKRGGAIHGPRHWREADTPGGEVLRGWRKKRGGGAGGRNPPIYNIVSLS